MTLAWIWAVILFPYVGPLFYFVFGTDRLVRQRLRATRTMESAGARVERKSTAQTEALVEQLSAAERTGIELLSQINEFAVSSVERTRLLIDRGQFFAALAGRIDQARDHVHIEFYIWRDDARGREMLDHLLAARRGVEVRLLLDGIGCFWLRAAVFRPLIAAGGKLELNALVRDRDRAADIERMLRHDFERGSHRIEEVKFLACPRIQRLKESLLRPLAPLL